MAELTTLARPYAKAAFEYAIEVKQLAEWSELLGFATQVVSDESMQQLLNSPHFTKNDQQNAMLKVCSDIQDAQAINFIKLLAQQAEGTHIRVFVVNPGTAKAECGVSYCPPDAVEADDIEIPFDVNRVFYLYDIPGGESRGAHAHKECHQFLIACSGSFDVILDDSNQKKKIQLNQPYLGLHIPPGIWASEVNFSSGAICLVLASHSYNEEDYIRRYQEFLKFK